MNFISTKLPAPDADAGAKDMDDLIKLLPDNIANQIAAGEVIQRPASAVKELMENALDAGADQIRLIVADAGKSLVQVMDNGRGMRPENARIAFERHATSKIRHIDDLFRIRTMGFRGEALASVAAVAQVELRTRRADEENGILLEIENSRIGRDEPVACSPGTSIAMRNLFFNVPARRNFLKSNAAEMRHIIDEFIRIALAFPEIRFSLTSNGQEVFHLEKGSLKQRIVQILGSSYSSRLVAVQEDTDYLNIRGFVGKPDTAKRTRGDQYFFVNNRFIRSAYLNHSVMTAFQEMIPGDSFPLYILFIEIDPARVDINVHPTKQEIKFEDEKLIYAFVQAAVKHSLAQFSITPSLDFDLDPVIQRLDALNKPITDSDRAGVALSSLYQTFSQKNQAHAIPPDAQAGLTHWKEKNAGGPPTLSDSSPIPAKYNDDQQWKSSGELSDAGETFQSLYSRYAADPLFTGQEVLRLQQLRLTYIICETSGGFLLIHQQSAHERVLYEKYLQAMQGSPLPAQSALFPGTVTVSSPDFVLLQELLPDLRNLGYLLEPFGKDCFIIQGTPAGDETGNEKKVIEDFLEYFKHAAQEKTLPLREKLIRSMAAQHAVKPGTALTEAEMLLLAEGLFRCVQPNVTPGGKPVFVEYDLEYLERIFKR